MGAQVSFSSQLSPEHARQLLSLAESERAEWERRRIASCHPPNIAFYRLMVDLLDASIPQIQERIREYEDASK